MKEALALVCRQAGVFDHGVKDGALVVQQLGRGVKLGYLALVHNHYAVVVKDGVEPVGNGQDGAAFELLPDRALDKLVRFLKK